MIDDELVSPAEYIRWAEVESGRPAKLGMVGPKLKVKSEDTEDNIEAEKSLELAYAYQHYQELMIQNGNLDYGDQIYLTYKLLAENKSILKKCREKFKYILIDEFQDTNYAQYQIIKLLSGKEGNITVVGDDDQSIYRFRGASISNILFFKHDFPSSREIVLNQNYRSS